MRASTKNDQAGPAAARRRRREAYARLALAVNNEIARIVNEPGISWKIRRALLRDKFNLDAETIDAMVGAQEPASDY